MHPRNVISSLKDRSQGTQSSPSPISKTLSAASSIAAALALFALVLAVAVPAPAQALTPLYSFTGYKDGGFPNGGLVLDPQGNLYGTAGHGGAHNRGAVFEVTPAGTETVLYSFKTRTGSVPLAGLVRDQKGNLYGTTQSGGFHNRGTVFEVTPSGTETVLHSFAKSKKDSYYPGAGLIFDAQGNLYGTTATGGIINANCPVGCGAVFELTPSGTETLLYKFKGGSDGAVPYAPVIFDKQGNLYGTTVNGGAFDCGTILELTPSGTENVLYTFTCGHDGGDPYGGLIFDAQGNLYGTTAYGGLTNSGCQRGCGVVFELTPSGAETVLHRFANGPDGAYPAFGLISDSNGNLYGAAYQGGAFNCGTIFELTPSGTENVLHTFTCGNDGAAPVGPLVFDSQGSLYGVAQGGGTYGAGTVFKLTP